MNIYSVSYVGHFFLSISQSTRFDSFSHLRHFLCAIVVVVALLVSFLHLSNTRLRLLRFKFLFILTVLLRWPLAFHAMLCVIVPFFSLPSSTLIQRFGIWWWSWCFVSFSSSTTSNTVQKSERHWTAIVIKYLTLRRHMMYKIRYITISHCELRHTHVIFFSLSWANGAPAPAHNSSRPLNACIRDAVSRHHEYICIDIHIDVYAWAGVPMWL